MQEVITEGFAGRLNADENRNIAIGHSSDIEILRQFAAGIAHYYNNIFTTIVGCGELLMFKVDKNDPCAVYVKQILDASERATKLTNDLTSFSMKQGVNLSPVDINKIIRRARESLYEVIGDKIKLEFDLTYANFTVMADVFQIERVLKILVTNARDAMPNGGTIKIKTEAIKTPDEFVEADINNKKLYAKISVEDNGVGMNKETREKIFKPFFSTRNATGLGLSIAYGLIRQHNGYINCLSELGKGTVFEIFLPIIKETVKGQ